MLLSDLDELDALVLTDNFLSFSCYSGVMLLAAKVLSTSKEGSLKLPMPSELKVTCATERFARKPKHLYTFFLKSSSVSTS